MIDLHLFSFPGKNGLRTIVDTCRPYLENKAAPLVAYLPAGTLGKTFQELTETAFHGLAPVATINTEMLTLEEMEEILRRANVLYIPGGNTYLLNHRLYLSRIFEPLQKKVQSGLPVVAFSAGTVLCGANILTSNDINIVPTTHFKGLQATPYNFNVHYPSGDPAACAVRDDWLSDYHTFQDNPVLLLADGAYAHVQGRKITLVCGDAWVLKKGQEKVRLSAGETIQQRM